MTSTLVPWDPAPAQGWKYMDDRSIAAEDPQAKEKVEQCLNNTAAFDLSIGYEENKKKRQYWSAAGGRCCQAAQRLGVHR